MAKRFVCSFENCGNAFDSKQVLDRHNARVHLNVRTIECDICQKLFKTKSNLFDHKQSHNIHLIFECDTCDKKFKAKKNLQMHKKTHTATRDFICAHCQRGFKLRHHLTNHQIKCQHIEVSQHTLNEHQTDALNIVAFEYPPSNSDVLLQQQVDPEPLAFMEIPVPDVLDQPGDDSAINTADVIATADTDPILTSRRQQPRRVTKAMLERIMIDRILSGTEDGLETQMVEGKGRGVFTTRTFAKGEFIALYKSELVDEREGNMRVRAYRLGNMGNFMFKLKFNGSVFFLDATKEPPTGVLSFGRLMNHKHSRDNPNTKPVKKVIENKPYIIFVATREIPAGEEVSYDYLDHEQDTYLRFPWMAALDDQASVYARIAAGDQPATQSTQTQHTSHSQIMVE